MADIALIYLAPGAFHSALARAPVLLQTDAAGTPRETTLEEALAALADGEAQLVVTRTEALLTRVTLTRKQARHLQRVLPFLLEEQMLEPPESLWFAAGKPEHGEYPVAVMARDGLDGLIALCHQYRVRPVTLKVDADLLAAQAPLTIDLPGRGVLILDRERALVVDEHQREALLALPDAAGEGVAEGLTRIDDVSTLCERLREGLTRERGVEVLQGPYMQRSKARSGPSPWAPWKPVAGLAAAVFVVALMSMWVQQWRYQRAAKRSFQQAATLYQSLFPDDRATAGLRRQFQARLARLSHRGTGKGSSEGLFSMLPAVASTLSGSPVTPKSLQFNSQDGDLLLDLAAKQYSDLEKLQAVLRQKGVKATIANYRNGSDGVTARIKVEQAG